MWSRRTVAFSYAATDNVGDLLPDYSFPNDNWTYGFFLQPIIDFQKETILTCLVIQTAASETENADVILLLSVWCQICAVYTCCQFGGELVHGLNDTSIGVLGIGAELSIVLTLVHSLVSPDTVYTNVMSSDMQELCESC